MNTLSLALYSEGPTDNRFLPSVIRKTARCILDEHLQSHIEISAIHSIEVKKKNRPESILQAAYDASGYHALIIHADADSPKADRARGERYEPGLRLIQQASGYLCKSLLPIIPIQAIEAWMLADFELLLAKIGTKLHPDDLNIPEKASMVESISKPKRRLEEAVQRAYVERSKRRRDTDIAFLYEPMGEETNLERLKQVPSYNQFVYDLTEVLASLQFIPFTHRT